MRYPIEPDVKKYFTETSLPEIDVTDRVMDRIGRNRAKPGNTRFFKAAVVPLVLVVMLTGVFAGAQFWQEFYRLKDKNGNVAWECGVIKGEENFTSLDQEYNRLFSYLYDLKIEEGKSLAAYMKSDCQPEGLCVAFTEPVILFDRKDLLQQAKDSYNLEGLLNILPEGYELTTAQIRFTDAEYDKEAFLEEARKSGRHIFVKEIPTNTESIRHISLHLKIAGGNNEKDTDLLIDLQGGNITDASKSLITFMTDDGKATSQAVMLNHVEALYSKYDNRNSLSWLQSGILITLDSVENTMSRTELAAFAKIIEEKYQP